MPRRNGRYPESEALVARSLDQQAKENPRFAKKLKSAPSSSPPNSSQTVNIRDAFKMGSAAKSKPAGASSSKPLIATSGNPQPPPMPAPRMASFCGADSDPFKHEEHGMSWERENHPTVEQDLEWLSNEPDFELEIESPVSLPPPPKPQPTAHVRPGQASLQVPADRIPQSSQGTAISWSSSPPSHKEPPAVSRSSSIRSTESAKRKLDEDYLERPAPKRKNLPFKRDDVDFTEDTRSASAETKTPVAKTRFNAVEVTASAIKEQQKNHRMQRTRMAESAAQQSEIKSSATAFATKEKKGLSMEEIHSITSGGPKPTEPLFLSAEQRHVLELVVNKGQSVFFTGPAGTGKSVLMRAIIAALKKKYAKNPDRVAVTASTGLAACNISGITLHSFSGIRLGKEETPDLIRMIRRNQKAKNRWLNTRVLIIDEISMVDGELFDKLSQIGRTIRNNGRPWGGIQLVITGDFFQLPPVPDGKSRASKFAFEAATWNTSIDHTIGLTQVFRQKDPEFAQMLNEMRVGKISEKSLQTFRSLSRELKFDDGIDTTELFPLRTQVELANNNRLQALPGRSYRFEALDTGDPKFRDKLLSNMMAPKTIDLKVGAQVMLIKNLDDQLVNGSIGKVKAFETQSEWEMANNHDGYGSGDDLMDVATAKKKIKKFANNTAPDVQVFPIVEFLCADRSHRTLQMTREDWKVELPTGEVQAARSQIPLILSWALSIHKAQGQTLERVKVDLGKVFENGQAYVALSRATTKDGLQILKFDKSKVMAHARVTAFYERLYSAEKAVAAKPLKQSSIQCMLGRTGGSFGSNESQSVSEEDRAAIASVAC